MKYELPCDIVKDLLPNYIDGLTGDSSTESVDAHLKKCKICKQRGLTGEQGVMIPYQNIKNLKRINVVSFKLNSIVFNIICECLFKKNKTALTA